MDQKTKSIVEILQPDLNITKELFDVDEAQIGHSTDRMVNYIRQTNNSANYYINFIENLVCIRPLAMDSAACELIKKLIEAVNTCFPKISEEIYQIIRYEVPTIRFVVKLDNGFDMKSNYNYQNVLFPYLQNDDSKSFIDYIENVQKLPVDESNLLSNYYYRIFDCSYGVTFVDFCCYYGSVNCFNYLISKNCKITEETLKWAIAG